MRIVTRYLLREFLRPFLLILVSFDAMFLVFDLFDNVSKFMETNFPVLRVLQYYGCLIASYSHWFAPASLMLATLYSMWTLSRNSEITAMRASGISFTRLSMPFLAVALAVAGLQWLNSEYLVPDAASWATRMKRQAFDPARIASDPRDKLSPYFAASHRQWTFQGIDTASEITASTVTGAVSVVQEDAAGSNKLWKITALGGAEFLDGEWWFRDPQVSLFDYSENGDGGELPIADGKRFVPRLLRLPRAIGGNGEAWPVETPRDIVLATREWENYSVRDMRRRLAASGVESTAQRYDLAYRFAAPWACLVITLFAVPAGLTTARQSILRGIFTAIGAFFGFYAMTHFCNFLGQGGHLPATLAAWLPNAIFFVIGIVNFRRLT